MVNAECAPAFRVLLRPGSPTHSAEQSLSTTAPGPSQYSFALLKNLFPECVLQTQPLRMLGAGGWGHLSTGYTAHAVSLGGLHHP